MAVDDFLSICHYQHDGSGYGDWHALLEILTQCQSIVNLLVYLAIPPNLFAEATRALQTSLQNVDPVMHPEGGFVRIILEKPFGRDTASCRALLESLQRQRWNESDLYRIDHYLGKPGVRNILSMRHHNSSSSSSAANPSWLWNRNFVHSVHIVPKESFGTAGRGGYFDPYGIIRDVLQNASTLSSFLVRVTVLLLRRMSYHHLSVAVLSYLRRPCHHPLALISVVCRRLLRRAILWLR